MTHQSSGPQSIREFHLESENAALQARIRELEASYEYWRARCEAKESELADICATLKACPWPPYSERYDVYRTCGSCGENSRIPAPWRPKEEPQHKPECPVSALEQIKSKLR